MELLFPSIRAIRFRTEMSWNYYGWRHYVPVAQRRAKAGRELAKLSKNSRTLVSPVVLEGRTITHTF